MKGMIWVVSFLITLVCGSIYNCQTLELEASDNDAPTGKVTPLTRRSF